MKGSPSPPRVSPATEPNGNSANPEWPSLAGQSEQYIRKQLQAFKGGAQNPLMTPMAASLSDDDMEDLGTFFACRSPRAWKPTRKLPLGQRIFPQRRSEERYPGVRRMSRPVRRR